MLPTHESFKEERFTVLKEGFVAICTYIEKGKVKTNYCAARLLNFYVNRYDRVLTSREITKHIFYCSETNSIKMESSVSYLEKCLLFEYSQNTIRAANKFLAAANLITIHRAESNNVHESNFVSINLCAIQEAEKPYRDTFIENAFEPQIKNGKLVFNGGGYCKFEVPPTANLQEGYFKFGHTNINTTIKNKNKKDSKQDDFFNSFLEEESKETPKSDFQSNEQVAPPPLSDKECERAVFDWIKANVETFTAIKKECGYEGDKDDSKSLVVATIAFWLMSKNFSKSFRAAPALFFEANYKDSLTKLLEERKYMCRNKEFVSNLLQVRYPEYIFSDWHIGELTKPMYPKDFENKCEVFYKKAKAKARTLVG